MRYCIGRTFRSLRTASRHQLKTEYLYTVLLVTIVVVVLLSVYVLLTLACDCSLNQRSCLPIHPSNVPFYARYDCPCSKETVAAAAVMLNLEEKRNAILAELGLLRSHAANMQSGIQTMVKTMNRLRLSISSAQQLHKDIVRANYPEVHLPLSLPTMFKLSYQPKLLSLESCSLDTCWNFEHCPLTSAFTIRTEPNIYGPQTDIARKVLTFLQQGHFTTTDQPCALVAVISSLDNLMKIPVGHDRPNNVLLLHVGSDQLNVQLPKNGLLASSWSNISWSPLWHIVVPHFADLKDDCLFETLPPVSPARRRYLFTVFDVQLLREFPRDSYPSTPIMSVLKSTHGSDAGGLTMLCPVDPACPNDDDQGRFELLANSTFTLLFEPNLEISSSARLQSRFSTALMAGAIPVLLSSSVRLPFDHAIDWRKATLRLPVARVTELHFLLRSLSDADIYELRRNGRFLWQNYLCNKRVAVETTIHAVRQRLLIPPSAVDDVHILEMYNESHPMHTTETAVPVNTLDGSEFLGPIETPAPSIAYRRNYSHVSLDAYEWWNIHGTPFHLYPHSPFVQALPTEAKFKGSHFGFRPIDSGRGGSGIEFSKALGGNFPKEQFTVVILTHRREQILVQALLRLVDLPYLNKVIVVWNDDQLASDDTVWPKLHVPVKFLRPQKNSLNNRFLPFAQIETEAVLSVDDDVQLRHDEIIFAFRVWRESRNRIVGFPGRFHSWNSDNNTWHYNSSHSCELSMVLTGAAFIHKYYYYLYTNWMPQTIRNVVDETFNCEDLAMNFLVSHVTRAPPIKVTSRWTFACPSCAETLSNDDDHYSKRHMCMELFTRIYGYNPLLYTQFRADSVLFKTKIPANHQKCFKFV